MTVKAQQSWNPGFWITREGVYDPKLEAMPLCVGIKLRMNLRDLCQSSGRMDGPRAEILRDAVRSARRAGKKIGLQIVTHKERSKTILDSTAPDYMIQGPGVRAESGGGSFGTTRNDDLRAHFRTSYLALHRKWNINGQIVPWVRQEYLSFLINALKVEFGAEAEPVFDFIELAGTEGFILPDVRDAEDDLSGQIRRELFAFYSDVRASWPEVVIFCPWQRSHMTASDARLLAQDLTRERIGISIPEAQEGTLDYRMAEQGDEIVRHEGLCRPSGNFTAIAATIRHETLDRYLRRGAEHDLFAIYDTLVGSQTQGGFFNANYIFAESRCSGDLPVWFSDVPAVSVDGIRVGASCGAGSAVSEQFDWYSVFYRRHEQGRYLSLTIPKGWEAPTIPPELAPVTDTQPLVEVRVNIGGGTIIDSRGYVWLAERAVSGIPDAGIVVASRVPAAGIESLPFEATQALFENYRRTRLASPGDYIRVPLFLTGGVHRVNFLFLEDIYAGESGRKFAYRIRTAEGVALEVTEYDPLDDAASGRAVVRSHDVLIPNDGRAFFEVENGSNGQAILSAIYVEPNPNDQGIGAPVITGISEKTDTTFLIDISPGAGRPTGYAVFLNGVEHQRNAAPSDNRIPVMNVPSAASYSVQVAAYTSTPAVESELSAGVMVDMTDTLPPTIPEGLTLTKEGSISILTWESSHDLGVGTQGYNVWRDDGLGGGFSMIGETGVESFQYEPDNNSTPYIYAVSARDKVGNESGLSDAQGGISINSPPAATDFSIERVDRIPVIHYANATDPDGDPIFIDSVGEIDQGIFDISGDRMSLLVTYRAFRLDPSACEVTLSDGKGGLKTVRMSIQYGETSAL